MAENPISSDSLTINFADLMSIPVADRALLAQQSPYFAAQLTTSLTPIELAKAFPDYYRRELPDISNFITSTIQGKLSKAGRGYDQTGGGDGGTTPSYYQGDVKLGAATPGDTTQAPATKPVPPSVVDRIMKEAGLSEEPTQGKFAAKETATETQKAVVDFANRWGINPLAAAGVFKVESGVTSGATNGGYHGVFQLGTDQVGPRTRDAGFGELTPEQFRNLSVSDQLKAMDEYYKYWKVKPGFFTGDPKTDTAKMWALQLAPGNAKKLDYSNPNVQIAGPGQAGIISAGGVGGPVTIGSATNSLSGGIDYLSDAVKEEAAAAVEDIKGPAALAITPELQEFIDSDPEIKKKFGDNAALARELQKAVDSGKTTIDKLKTVVSDAKTTAEAIKNVSGEMSEDPYDFWKARNPRGASFVGPDGKPISRELLMTTMMAVKKFEAEHPGKRVEIYGKGGGVRESSETKKSQHLLGHALDMAIYEIDPQTGKRIDMGGSNNGNYPNFPGHGGGLKGTVDASVLYDRLQEDVELARIYKAEIEGDSSYRYGVRSGTFFPGAYTLDTMHTDIGGTLDESGLSNKDYGYGNLLTGASEALMREKGIDPNSEAGQELMTGLLEKHGGTKEGVLDAAKKAFSPEAAQQDIVPPKQLPSKPTDDIPAPTAQQAPDIVPPKTDKQPEELVSPVQGQSTPEVPVATFRTGGSPDVQDDEDLTAVGSDGKPAFKFNSGEGLYVKPEADEYADDKIEELSDKINKIDEMYQKNAGAENTRKPSLPDKLQPEQDSTWRKRVASASVSPGSQSRAFRRSKFRDEGFHWGRGSPNSITN